MPKTREIAVRKLTLDEALAKEAYQWMAANVPELLDAIEYEMSSNHLTAEEVRRQVSQNVGPERQALATRCYQAARWMFYIGPEGEL